MRRIYTRKGDFGTTGIAGGERVDKDDIRIETNGVLDELNVSIGMLRAMLSPEHEWNPFLRDLQRELMEAMAVVATPSSVRKEAMQKVGVDFTSRCEDLMDELMKKMDENNFFVLPGGTIVSSQMHVVRTLARKAERRLCTLNREDAIPDGLKAFLNRLSDLFFVMARYEVKSESLNEEQWKQFGYRRKSE